MLKQKFIPLLSMTLLLFGCNSNTKIALSIEKQIGSEVKSSALISEKIALKDGENITFDIHLSDIKKLSGGDEEKGAHSFFLVSDFNESRTPLTSFLNCLKLTAIKYNGKNLEFKAEGDAVDQESKFVEWHNIAIDEDTRKTIDNTYAVGTFQNDGVDAQLIEFVHCDINKDSDEIQIDATCVKNVEAVATFVPNYLIFN